MSITSSEFNNMYHKAVKKNYPNKKDAAPFVNYGGLDKLKSMLFDNENILSVVDALESFYSKKFNFLETMITDSILVLTDKRIIYLQKKLFGTATKEIPKKQFLKIEWENNCLKFADFQVYSTKMNSIKKLVYDLM